MSLDVSLYTAQPGPAGTGIFVRENGSVREITRAEWDERFPGIEPLTTAPDDRPAVFESNITHNLGTMAEEAGIYEHLWRPDEIGIHYAADLIEPLRTGLALLRSDPARFEAFNPENGWGSYENLVEFVAEYLRACEAYPAAVVGAYR